VLVGSDSSPQVIPEHESGVRRLMADSGGEEYVAYESAEAARHDPDAALVMEGDYGGHIYLACPLRVVGADETALKRLLGDLDRLACEWDDGAAIRYERLPVGSGVAGGMGGGLVAEEIWVHEEFVHDGLDEQVRQVVLGERDRLRS
jgi:hypothetical protein